MTRDHEDIIRQSASSLARSIADGVLSAVDVIDAHIRRIEEVNPTLNAVVVELFDQARTAAREARPYSTGVIFLPTNLTMM